MIINCINGLDEIIKKHIPGLVGGWIEVKAVLKIAHSNQQICFKMGPTQNKSYFYQNATSNSLISCWWHNMEET